MSKLAGSMEHTMSALAQSGTGRRSGESACVSAETTPIFGVHLSGSPEPSTDLGGSGIRAATTVRRRARDQRERCGDDLAHGMAAPCRPRRGRAARNRYPNVLLSWRTSMQRSRARVAARCRLPVPHSAVDPGCPTRDEVQRVAMPHGLARPREIECARPALRGDAPSRYARAFGDTSRRSCRAPYPSSVVDGS